MLLLNKLKKENIYFCASKDLDMNARMRINLIPNPFNFLIGLVYFKNLSTLTEMLIFAAFIQIQAN